MPGPAIAYAVPPGMVLRDFAALPSKERPAMAAKVAKLERKVFPSNEGFDYDVELKKKNIGLILAFKEHECNSENLMWASFE